VNATIERKLAILLAVSLLLVTTLACGQTPSPTSAPVVKTATPAGGAAETQPIEAAAAQQATNVPAATSAPTSTPRPTDVPKPTITPKPLLSLLQVVSSSTYTDAGYMYIVGEVTNNSDVPQVFVKIVATLYDDAGKVAGTDYSYTALEVIPPKVKRHSK